MKMKLKELLESVTNIYYEDYPKSMYANINNTSEYPIDWNSAGVQRYLEAVRECK